MTRHSAILLTFLAFLAACQPAPEERFTRAQNYFAESDYRAVVLELKNALQARPDYPEARLLLGKASYQLADFPTAQAEFERALSQGQTGEAVWAELGKALLAQGDAAGVLERVVPNIDAETAEPITLVVLGDTYLALNNRDEAAAHYQLARDKAATTPGAIIGQAVIARLNDDTAGAEALLDEAIELNPDDALPWRAKGNFLRSTRRNGESADAYDRSIELESGATPLADRLMVRVNRVSALLDNQEIDEAQSKFDDLQSAFPSHPIVRFLRGRVAYATGDYALAETELREYLADIPNDLRGYALLGAVSFSQNHLRQAETYLAQAVRNNVGGNATARLLAETRLRLNKPGEALSALGPNADTSDAALLAMYGRAQLGLGNTAAALEYFEQGAEAGEGNPAIGLSLAAGFFAAGDTERAIAILESMPGGDDDRYRKETLLIAAHLKEGNKADALRVGGDVLKANPEDPAAYSLVGALYQSIGDFVAARSTLERGLRLDPTHLASNYALSRLETIEGNDDKATELLYTLLDNHPTFMPALVTLAGLYVKDGKLSDLLPRLDAAVAADSRALAPRLLQIRVLMLDGDPLRTMEAITEAKNIYPDEPRIAHAEGLVNVQQGNTEAALISLRRAASDAPDNAVFQFDYASLSFSSGNVDEAEAAIGRYREMQPDNYRGMALQVAIQARRGNFDAARATANNYAQAYPEERSVDILQGDIEMAAGNSDAAARLYQTAANRDFNRDIAFRLARAYQSNSPTRATETISRWLEISPDDSEARRLYGQLLESQGDKSRAVAEYERVLASGNADPIALNNLAWQYSQDGRPEAADLAKRAFELAPENGSIADTYGWILYGQGEYERALELLQEAARLSPQNPEIQFHLAAAHAKTGDKPRASQIVNALLTSNMDFPSRAEAQALANTL